MLRAESRFNQNRVPGISKYALKNLHWAACRGDHSVTIDYIRKDRFVDDLVVFKREKLDTKISGKGDFRSIKISW